MTEATQNGLVTLIMAGGKGTRMKSDIAKVLHPLCGRPMIHFTVETAQALGSERIIVIVGHQAEAVTDELEGYPVEIVEQREQLGTGHAVMQAQPLLKDFSGTLLVLAGDTPLIQEGTLRKLCDSHLQQKAAVTILTAIMEDPFGLGRIVRDKNDQVIRIVEEKDATAEEREIKEINSSIYCFDSPLMFDALMKIKPDNKQGELYLTDTIAILREAGGWVAGAIADNADDTIGINTVEHLAQADRIMRSRLG